MLERGVEVDVVRDLEREVLGNALARDQLLARVNELDCTRDHVLPGRTPEREELVQRLRLERRAEPGQIEDAVADPEADARRRSVRREDAEPDDALHSGSTPSASSSSTGSKKLQLPIARSRSLRAWSSSAA